MYNRRLKMAKFYEGSWIIKGIKYVEFSCLKASEGGIAKTDALAILKEHGIKARGGAYSPYVGHYGIYVEEAREQEASNLLFG
jgi:hypothetical protein